MLQQCEKIALMNGTVDTVRPVASILMLTDTYCVPGKRFSELQDEFFETSKRLRLAQTPELKLELLTELQRIVKESKRALAETGSQDIKNRFSIRNESVP
jgi:hypothetical protein